MIFVYESRPTLSQTAGDTGVGGETVAWDAVAALGVEETSWRRFEFFLRRVFLIRDRSVFRLIQLPSLSLRHFLRTFVAATAAGSTFPPSSFTDVGSVALVAAELGLGLGFFFSFRRATRTAATPPRPEFQQG